MISLHRLDPAELHRLARLRTGPGQQRFVGSGAGMIRDPAEGVTFHEIRAPDGRAVGMFKLDPLYWRRHDFATPQDVGLRGLLIDAAEQGKGFGSAALVALAAHVHGLMPDRQRLFLTVNTANPIALRAYRRARFKDHGGIYLGSYSEPQFVLWLALG